MEASVTGKEDFPIIDWTDKLNNFDERIRFLVIHHTVSETLEKTIDAFRRHGTSSHYVVDYDGQIYRVVEDEKRAWHAGVSDWGAASSLNYESIGIEIVNHGNHPFPDEQMDSVIRLSKSLVERYGIKPQNIVGHADIAPDRKSDPSGYFDWKKFYAFLGVYDGLFDSALTEIEQREVLLHSESTDTERILKLQQDLAAFGYRVIQTGVYDLQTQLVVEAFNRHFSPEVFIKEKVLNRSMIQNPENQKWFGISQERLDFLLSNRKI